MSDGSQQGIGADRALRTIVGGEEQPKPEEERTPAFWRASLEAKDDGIEGYDEHAAVMAKYIVRALIERPELARHPIEGSWDWGDPPDYNREPKVTALGLSDVLKAEVYTDEAHPFRRALSDATGFTWGWAFNIARYALGLPPQPNPAIITIEGP